MTVLSSSDFFFVFKWWALFFGLTLTVLPLTGFIFKRFLDRGYIFTKTLALAFLSYAALLLGSMHLLPFTIPGLLIIVFIITVINYGGLFFYSRKKFFPTITEFLTRTAPILLLEELLFFLAILFWSWVRSFSPDIHGLEKYMDFGFMNSISRTEFFPPRDMWLTPFSINYYFFGHLTGAVLTKLSGIPSNYAYNLILAGIFGLCFVGSFSLGLNLYHLIGIQGRFRQIKYVLAGLLTACLVALAGNLHTLYTFFKAYENESPVPPWQLSFLPNSFPNAYWYPNATRYIFNTIHEFPIYSWVVADLHGHVFDIPFVITFLSILLSLALRTEPEKGTKYHSHRSRLSAFATFFPYPLWYLPLLGLMLSLMYMTNAWDGLIYLMLAGLFVLYFHLSALPPEKFRLSLLLEKSFFLPFIFAGASLFVGFLIFSLPFSLHFKPFVSGIGVLCAPDFLVQKGSLGPLLFEAQHCQRSPWWQLLILYGFFYFFIFSFLAFLTRVRNIRIADTFVLLLIILGTLLIIIPEFIYVKDIYPAHYRANTMFKLVFQSFLLLSITSSYAIIRIISSLRQRRLLVWEKVSGGFFIIVAFFLLSLVFIYPFQAINSYYGELKNRVGLNGTTYLDTLYPSDYKAIAWLNAHVPGQPVILEAQGDSYTDFARVSANTGLPTVLGWTVHEWLWRNSYDIPVQPPDPKKVYDVPAPRIAEVTTLYESSDLQETKRLLNKYHVEYVFIGVMERQKYQNLNEAKWNELGNQIFRNGLTSIYRINPS
jgi:uncharacterized membrane protein